MKDIGVTINSNLTFNEHINIKIDTANKILGIIRRSYRFINCETFLPSHRSMMRSHFDYAVSVLGYEPAGLTVHPPPQNDRGRVNFFRMGV